jgi:hypothetical protein
MKAYPIEEKTMRKSIKHEVDAKNSLSGFFTCEHQMEGGCNKITSPKGLDKYND